MVLVFIDEPETEAPEDKRFEYLLMGRYLRSSWGIHLEPVLSRLLFSCRHVYESHSKYFCSPALVRLHRERGSPGCDTLSGSYPRLTGSSPVSSRHFLNALSLISQMDLVGM